LVGAPLPLVGKSRRLVGTACPRGFCRARV